MKKIILLIVITLSLALGFNAGTVLSNTNKAAVETTTTNYVYVRVYQDGAIWVYVYTEDGTFVAVYIEQQL